MRYLLIVLSLLLMLPGCASMRRGNQVDGIYDGVSREYPGDAQELAAQVADELASRYPPGLTTLSLAKTNDAFGQDLEAALRTRGFSVAAADGAGIRITYTLDMIQEHMPLSCYIRVKASDGSVFGSVKEISGIARQPDLSPDNTASQAQTSLATGHDLPSAPATSPAISSPLSSSAPSASVPVSSLERKGATDTVSVRKKGTAASIAKRNKIAVDDFCQWNDVLPTTVLHAGQHVSLHGPIKPSTPPREVASASSSMPTPASGPVSTPSVSVMPVGPSTPPREVASASPSMSTPAPGPGSTPPASVMPVGPSTPPKETASAPSSMSTPAPGPGSTPPASVMPVGPSTSPKETASAPSSMSTPAPGPGSTPGDDLSVETWTINKGSLQAQLESWANRAQYHVIWRAAHDFDLEAMATFEGDFVAAIKQLFLGLHRSGNALRVTVYQSNKVVEVAED